MPGTTGPLLISGLFYLLITQEIHEYMLRKQTNQSEVKTKKHEVHVHTHPTHQPTSLPTELPSAVFSIHLIATDILFFSMLYAFY